MSEQITVNQLADELRTIKGATMISFVAKTEPRLRKTGNNLGTVYKVAKVNGVLNFNYENAVNRQREREDKTADFQSQGRTWGECVGPLVMKGEIPYLQFKHERTLSKHYENIGGGVLADDVVEAFMSGSKTSNTQQTEKPIRILNYKLSNVTEMWIKGKHYVII